MILLVIWLHTFADFVLQTDKMAKGKSTSLKWLSIHVAVYSLPLLILGYKYAIINASLHFGVDFITSKMTSALWKKGDVHNFFVVIGIDQALHITMLILTLPLANPVFKWIL